MSSVTPPPPAVTVPPTRNPAAAPTTVSGSSVRQTLLNLWPYVWEFRGRVMIALALLVAAKLANVAVPLALKEIVDRLDVERALLTLPVAAVLLYGGLRFASSALGELRDGIFARVTQHAIRRVSVEVFRHLHGLSLRFHLERRTGGVMRDIERGSRGISFVLDYMVFSVLPTLLEIALVSAILVSRYPIAFAAVTLAALSLYIVFTVWVTEWRMRFRRTMNEFESQATTRAVDSLLNYETVKYFNNEDFEARRYDARLGDWEQAAVRSETSLAALNAGQSAIIATGVTVLLYMAADGVAAGRMTLGDLVLINAFLFQLFVPLNMLGFIYREIRHSVTDMGRMFDLLNRRPEVNDAPGAPPLVVRGGAVRFERVSFAYDPERPILHEVSFEIPAGHKLAVVGTSGAGKSTLARLLNRFYDVSGGRILVDGQDVRAVTQASLRAAVGVVPQDTVLFNDSIYANILYGRPDAGRDAVVAAGRAAHRHDVIRALPAGYDTVVGERGLKLSGGEKQRVAIARTILKSPPILVFDEATSALDSRSERAIQAELGAISRAHTTLVIAHRLSTVVDADEILVLEHGRVVERGTHAALLAAGGAYAQMWSLQQRQADLGQDAPDPAPA